jgi:3',5'-cyclic-AMP phosphodiesterase
MLRIVQISDIHLFADPDKELLGVNTQASFQAVCDKILNEENAVQLILLSGDLSQDHTEGSYLQLSDMLKPLGVPVYYAPGNHDDLTLMTRLFPRENISNHKHIVFKNWQIILLNSQKPGAVEGCLDESQITYLQHCLQAYPEHQAIILFHHQPLPVGCEWLDNLGLKNAREFWKIVANYPNVHTVLFGHVHQVFEQSLDDINCYSAPSTCFQFKRKRKRFTLENLPPGYRWLNLHEDGRLETGVNRVDRYVGTFEENAKGY